MENRNAADRIAHWWGNNWWGRTVLHLLFPHQCHACGKEIETIDDLLCERCLFELPVTTFWESRPNVMEKILHDKIDIDTALAGFYYRKKGVLPDLISDFKYHGKEETAIYLGKLLGQKLMASRPHHGWDALVPVPLSRSRLLERGYNQALSLCQGINAVTGIPILDNVLERSSFQKSQTQKNFQERQTNVQGAFQLVNSNDIKGKHIALVDDVFTTGATAIECGEQLLSATNTKLSLFCLGFTQH